MAEGLARPCAAGCAGLLAGIGAASAQDGGAMPSAGLIGRLAGIAGALGAVTGPIWAALPSVPGELGRAAIGIAMAPGPGLGVDLAKAAFACALVFLAAALPRWLTRSRIADGGGHDPRLASIMRRFGQDIAGALAACLVAVLLSELAFDPAVASGQLARALLDFALLFRLALMVPVILFRPGEADLRLLRAHDVQIARARPWLVAALGVGIGFPALIPVWLGNGMDWAAGQALAVAMGLVAAGLGLLAAERFLSPVPGLWRRWRVFAGLGAIGFWLAWSYGVVALDFPFFFAVIRLGAVVVVGVMADRFVATALRTARAAEGGIGQFWLAYGAPLRRVIVALGLAGVVVVMVGWAAEAGPDWLGPGRLVMLRARIAEGLAVFLVGYLLFEGFGAWLTARFVPAQRGPHPVADEDEPAPASRLVTVVPVARGFLGTLILGVSALVALSTLGLDTTPLLAGAGIFGLAISFGSQSLVRDVVAGIFFLADDAFRLGEYIETGKLKGSVERITLRSIQLRHQNGQIHTLPFGQLGSVTNFSRDWVTMKFNLRLARDVDIEIVRKTVKRIGQELLVDVELGREFIQPLKLQGIADILENALVLRFKFTVRPAKPTVVQREALKRIVRVFAEKGIRFAANTVFVESREDDERLREAGAQVAAQTVSAPAG